MLFIGRRIVDQDRLKRRIRRPASDKVTETVDSDGRPPLSSDGKRSDLPPNISLWVIGFRGSVSALTIHTAETVDLPADDSNAHSVAGCGHFRLGVHVSVAGSCISTAPVKPLSSLVAPPIAYSLPLTTATPSPPRADDMSSNGDHVFVLGSYDSTVVIPRSAVLYPPTV